ncbi:MAG: CoA pyrophosphatase [Myxococcales bacterium]|nr:CoA pyrophosphatase [Polyangiaceae bacterium]MDW8250612.1 CoA pyrophosphatase [Myxococcales bacterium]
MIDLGALSLRLTSRPRRTLNEQATHRASVAAILRCSLEGPEILLLKRAENPLDPWSGNVAFPGGRREPEDADSLATALRETLEESGLDLHRYGRYLGPLDDLPAVARGRRTGMIISPHVFELLTDEEPKLQVSEIAAYRWAPIAPLLRGEQRTQYPYRHEGQLLHLPAYDLDGWLVWGLTFHMLQMLLEELRGG